MRNVLIICGLLTSAASAVQAGPWNVDIFLGKSASNTLEWGGADYDVDSGSVYGLAVSKSDVFTPNLEIGAELSRAKAEYSCCNPNSIEGTSLMATAKYNFVNSGNFEAYAGAGLGLVNVKYTNAGSYANSETVFGGQLTLGARYKVSPNMKVYVEGRYVKANDAMVAFSGATADAEFNSKAVVLGLRTSF